MEYEEARKALNDDYWAKRKLLDADYNAKLKALGDARKAGFISEESFKKEKKRLEEKLDVSKK